MQLVELEDLPWVPVALRDGGTDLLDLGFDRIGFYAGVVPKLRALLSATGRTRIVDVCSGGGGGALYAHGRLRSEGSAPVEMLLTDRYPNESGRARVAARGDAALSYRESPVDALAMPAELTGVRTMWGALHHFPPEAVGRLLEANVRSGEPIAFFDVAASPALRKLPIVLAPIAMSFNMLMLFIGSLLLVPLVRPVRLSRLVLTYLLPLIPILVAWDGTVSAIRAYAPDELLAIARSVPGGEGYEWESGVEGSALYLTGRPRVAQSAV